MSSMIYIQSYIARQRPVTESESKIQIGAKTLSLGIPLIPMLTFDAIVAKGLLALFWAEKMCWHYS